MIARRTLLRGLAAGTASISLSSNSALASVEAAVRNARYAVEDLPACIIACEENEASDENTVSIDYWSFMVSNVYGALLPDGCCKVAIWDRDLSPGRVMQDVAHLYRSIPEHFDFDPLSHPHHSTLHVEGVTDLRERIRSVLAVKSSRASTAKVALINEDSACFHLSADWLEVLPSLRAHYDHVIGVSISDEGSDAEFHDPEFDAYWRQRREKIAGLCDAVVEIVFPCVADAEDEDGYEKITERTCEIANALLRKTPAEISALPACGVIPFRDWMALVA